MSKKNESVGFDPILKFLGMIHLCYQKNAKGGTGEDPGATFYIFPDNLSDKWGGIWSIWSYLGNPRPLFLPATFLTKFPRSLSSARKPLSDESRSDDQRGGRNDTASPYNPSSQGIRPSADSAIFPIFRLLCTIFQEALIPEAINLDQTSLKRSHSKRGGGSLPPWRLPRPAE